MVANKSYYRHSDEEDDYATKAHQRNWTGLRILVVEDEPDTAATMASILRLEGHRVKVVPDSRSAFLTAQDEPPDVVLLDIGLPGVSGWELAKQLWDKAAPKKPLLIALTGYGRPADRRRSEEAGIHLHLVKPVDPDFLLAVLRRFQGILMPGRFRQFCPW
jgi:DNA-binding response OmpR family regulator